MIAASTNPVPLLPSPPQSRSLPSPRYPVFAASTSIVVAAAALAAADRTVVIKRPARHRLTLTVSTVACGIWVGWDATPARAQGHGDVALAVRPFPSLTWASVAAVQAAPQPSATELVSLFPLGRR